MLKYDNDVIAVDLKSDGSGFIYYPNKTVAICISQATDYQNSFYAFDKDRSNLLLLALDERGTGFCTCSKRKSAETDGTSLVFTTKGGIISNNEGKIIYDWKWDRNSLDAGIEPPDTIIIRINENLILKYKNRTIISLEFQCENIRQIIDLGIKVKRNTCYLDNAKKETGGRLIPQIPNVTLKDRQNTFTITMKAQQNKLHPKSENLSNMVKDIVQKMENDFDDINKKLATTPYFDGTWKSQALENTLREIPRIPIAGTETGVFSGFGSKLYLQKDDFNMTKTIPDYLVNVNGTVKNELEIRNTIMELNPPLKRTSMLRAASGRYSSMLIVNKNAITASNPTGMVEPLGIPLEKIHWKLFKDELISQAGAKGPLIVALVMRSGDPICCEYQRITELVNRDILYGIMPHTKNENIEKKLSIDYINSNISGFRLIKLEVSEERDIMHDLGIKSLPTFVMFSHGNIVYAGPLGGRKVKSKSESCKPQILIIEPNAADQIKTEKTLRKLGCDTFLCLTAIEAIDRIQKMCLSGNNNNDHSSVIFDLILISEEIQTNDVITLSKRLEDFTKINRTLICIMVSVLGTNGYQKLHAVHWEHSTIKRDLNILVSPPLSNITEWAMQKPIKANSIELLLSRRNIPIQEETMGLTESALFQKMKEVQNDLATNGPKKTQPMIFPSNYKLENKLNTINISSIEKPYIGICMSAADVKIRGKLLINNLGNTFRPNETII